MFIAGLCAAVIWLIYALSSLVVIFVGVSTRIFGIMMGIVAATGRISVISGGGSISIIALLFLFVGVFIAPMAIIR